MADLDADIWVCGECRSINNLRAKQCYRCRTPRDVAAVDPNQIEGTVRGRLREIALPEFRSTRWAAVLASAMLILVAVMQVVSTVSDAILFGRVLGDPEQLADPAFYQSTESLVAGTVAVATLGVALLALIAWSFWLSRAVMAMPALGLGYPAANGLMTFVENFLPGLNLFRVPAIVRDVMRRLDPGSLRGEALIFAAWIGLLGGYLVPRFGAYLGLLGSGTLEEIVRETLLVQAIATALVVVGATFLVALIWWIERKIARRRAAQLAGELPLEAAVAGASPGTVAMSGAQAPGEPRLDGEAGEPRAAVPAPAGPASEAASVAPIVEGGAAGPLGTIASRAESGTYTSRSITAATGIASTPLEAPPAETTLASSPSAEVPAAEVPAAEVPAAEVPAAEVQAEEAPLVETPMPPGSPPVEQAPPPVEDAVVAAEPSPAVPEPAVEPSPEPVPEASFAPSEPPVEPSPMAAAEESPGAPEPPVETSAAEAPEPAAEPPGEAVAGPQLHLRVESVSSMIATMDGESEPITLDELRVAAGALARANGSAVIETVGTSFGALSLAEQAFEVLEDAQVVTSVQE